MQTQAINPRQEWSTPDDFYSVIEREFRPTIDVAASAENAKCADFINLDMDALDEDTRWLSDTYYHVAWCNPGFANMTPWVKKAYEESRRFEGGVVLVLGLIAPSAKWWMDWALEAAEIRLIGGKRIQFDPAPGIKRSSNSRENCLMVFRGGFCGAPRIWTWDWTDEW